jgi:hypothetical protein
MAAPAEKIMKHPGGQPLKFQNLQELETKIDEYFAWCDSRTALRTDKQGNTMTVPWPRPYTLSGLADYLDCDRRTLLNYRNRDKYFPTIMRARRKCERYAAEQLFEGNDRGAKFSLINNHDGWAEKQEIVQTTTIQHQLDLSLLTVDQLQQLQQIMSAATPQLPEAVTVDAEAVEVVEDTE